MAYQALYRKYRPVCLDDVVGQEAVIQTLKNAVCENRVSHAYLFTGPRGTGKTSVAKLFSKMVNCIDSKDGNPCNECEICTKIMQKEIADIIEIDAASNNGVDEIREIRNKANLVPSVCKYKVYIIDEVHMLSTGAFNALLKTLEEPPQHIIFILATTEVHKIPLTIISRCQRFDFKKISKESLVKRLTYIANSEQIHIDDEAISHIADICDGGMRDSIGVLDQLCGYQTDHITTEDVDIISGNISDSDINLFLQKIFENDYEYVLMKINEYNQNGKNLLKFVEKLILNLRNTLLYVNARDYFQKHYTIDSSYANLATYFQKIDVYLIIDQLTSLLNDMKINSSHQVLLEIKMMQLMSFEKKPVLMESPPVDKKNDTSNLNLEIDYKQNLEVTPLKNDDSSVLKEEPTLKGADDSSWLTNLIKIRVNNTFYDANKQILNDFRSQWSSINQYTIDKTYADSASLLLDGEVKAAGTKNLIVSYPYESMASRANHDLKNIEQLIQEVFHKNYKFIAISNVLWQQMYQEFVKKWKKKETYEYIEEREQELPKELQNSNDPFLEEAVELFGDLVKIE